MAEGGTESQAYQQFMEVTVSYLKRSLMPVDMTIHESISCSDPEKFLKIYPLIFIYI